MARAATKHDLILSAENRWGELWALIDSLNEREQHEAFHFDDRDKNLRDVLVHLYEWHMLFILWIHANLAGEKASFLPEPYNWKTYPQMNVELWKKHQKTPLHEAKALLKESHSEVMKLIEAFTDEQLFTKKYFPWTGTAALGAYAISAAPSHYDWAMKKIKKAFKQASKTHR